MATLGSMSCSSAIGLSRPPAGRTCGANSLMSTTATGSPIAKEALDRIGQLYLVEKIINGSPPERRQQQRQLHSKPIAEALAAWAAQTVRRRSRKSELAQAFRYMRARWTALVRCFDDGRLALDNNPAERALRCVAIGRKNYLFAGSDAGGRRA